MLPCHEGFRQGSPELDDYEHVQPRGIESGLATPSPRRSITRSPGYPDRYVRSRIREAMPYKVGSGATCSRIPVVESLELIHASAESSCHVMHAVSSRMPICYNSLLAEKHPLVLPAQTGTKIIILSSPPDRASCPVASKSHTSWGYAGP